MNLDSRTYFSSSLIIYLVLVSCFSFSEGRGKNCEFKPTTVRKFTKVCTPESERSTRDITRLRHMPNCNVHLHEKIIVPNFTWNCFIT